MTESDLNPAGCELLSDLMDGRLRGETREQALRAAARDRQCLETWAIYHLIGDALRSREFVPAGDDAQFADRVRMRIEATRGGDLGAGAWFEASTASVAELPGAEHGLAASNRPSYRLIAGGLGAVALAVVVAWLVAGRPLLDQASPQLVQGGAPAIPVAAPEPAQPMVMIRDARLDELLAAHKQSGGPTALQRPAGFLRNAAFEEGPTK